jgi:hypothetical protein
VLPPKRPTATFLPFEVLRALDVGFAHDAVGQKVLHAADEDEIVGALHDGAHVADRSGDANFGVAAYGSRRWRRGRGMKTRLKSRSVFLNRPASRAIRASTATLPAPVEADETIGRLPNNSLLKRTRLTPDASEKVF